MTNSDKEQKTKLDSFFIKGEIATMTISFNKDRIVDENLQNLFNYDFRNQLKRELTETICKEILKDKKEEIIKEVLLDVNWPEIVRSDIAQKVIKEISSGRSY